VSERRPLTGTYRLQLHAEFDFRAAAGIVPYLADLGVSHLYLSPILQAAPGSMHGYDVVDHSAISAELGGIDGFLALVDIAHRQDLGIVVDVVPNHMAVPTPVRLNVPLWETLREGQASRFAHWFDIDWDLCGGKIGLPLLGETLEDAVSSGRLTLGNDPNGERVLRYGEQLFPLRPDTTDGELADILDQQHYVLAHWRDKADVLGYRRFFDVDTLIAVRVELPDVFEHTHRLLLDLFANGSIDGFRIDHPDGLADPEGYLDQLHQATDGAWVVVEKILIGDERLPASWATAGTTGYDALAVVQAAFAPTTGAALESVWEDVASSAPSAGTPVALADAERAAKADVIERLLQPEVRRLARRASEAAADASIELDLRSAQAAFEAMLVHVETYRAYIRLGVAASREATALIDGMVARARAEHRDLSAALATLRYLLLDTATTSPAGRDLVVRFQQVCGPVMAKGVEDTTFYRWHRFVALNEVGGDPTALDRPGPEPLHRWADHQASAYPRGITALSTHDTKRDEDVRARLLAAGEDVERWTQVWALFREVATSSGVDAPTAYLLMQTVVGAWPISDERLKAYAEKAVREAKQLTSWNNPDLDYEKRVAGLVETFLSDGPLASTVEAWVADLSAATRAVRLSSKLIQLMLPGVPDVYQGTEVVGGRVVDPDNRQPVDFAYRASVLDALPSLDAQKDPVLLQLDGQLQTDDALKLLVTSRALQLRRDHPHLFGPGSSHQLVESTSACAWGLLRSGEVAALVQRWPGRLAAEGWREATLKLPSGEWTDILSGRQHHALPELRCEDIYRDLPVALLVRKTS
jgi:(1->4)-alpha-D-glucan 1-alpha-D-glucosylmutase